ncbi:hypothetical protein LTR16_002657 [Cryomyces antarcticus]|uniref:COMPASS complex Set1 subunit N-SET domain-containing protein n=1 Tax=Cryomyces antarcticus TaxID=329879 RepID=A0ABR0LRE7_9PEZI|nr:hypothetical protein LTR04_002710 [Oleoguttula sp. CCFEE 6159]KAK5201442.1 hypothetical protein LTR16_002657 [Cryomyces antarcticus]
MDSSIAPNGASPSVPNLEPPPEGAQQPADPISNGIPPDPAAPDVEMKEEPLLQTQPLFPDQPPPLPPTTGPSNRSTPAPALGLMAPKADAAARAVSIPQQPVTFLPPPAPNPHGSPTRVYLNQNVTPHLLEGMKYLAAHEPEKPLKWLSEFLAGKSAEVEGTS